MHIYQRILDIYIYLFYSIADTFHNKISSAAIVGSVYGLLHIITWCYIILHIIVCNIRRDPRWYEGPRSSMSMKVQEMAMIVDVE